MIHDVLRISLLAALPALALGCNTTPAADAGTDAGAPPGDSGPDEDACLACGEDGGPGDGGLPDADDRDAGSPDGGPAPIPPGPVTLGGRAGHDRFYAVAFDAAGNVYAVGQTAAGIDAAADFEIMVARFGPSGELDTSFGGDGVATHNVQAGGRAREVGRAVVVQSTGRVVVLGNVEHDPAASGVLANDTDIALVAFTHDGELDTSFGTGGVERIDLNDGIVTVNSMGMDVLTGGDDAWSMALTPTGDGLVIHARGRADGFTSDGTTPRSDTDWTILRRTADGAPDTTFSGDGEITVDVGQGDARARGVTVLDDGRILGSGYQTSNVLFPGMPTMTTQQPVLFRITAAGEMDATFATADLTTDPGVWHDFAVTPPLRAEAYAAALQGDRLVTIGYGPTPSPTGTGSDIISLRFTADGTIDRTYGPVGSNGVVYVDVAGFAENGHGAVVLPDGRIMGAGVGRPTMAESDLMLVRLGDDGVPDTTFGAEGAAYRTYDVGLNDQLWAIAMSPDESRVAAVGLAGAESPTDDDDGVLVILSTLP